MTGHDVPIPRLGVGTAPLGGLYRESNQTEADAVVQLALSAGAAYFDTAPLYGSGLSETRLGRALAGVPRESFTVSTKVGRLLVPGVPDDAWVGAPPLAPVFDWSRDGVRRSIESSLVRLGLDHVDVVYAHDPDDHEHELQRTGLPALLELRDEGVARAVGVGMNSSRLPTRLVSEWDIDVVLVAGRVTLLDRSAEADLLPTALERGVSIVCGGVFNSGVLADPDKGSYDYGAASDDVRSRALRLRDACRARGTDLLTAALRYPLSRPGVTGVVVGVSSAPELAAAIAARDAVLDPSLFADLLEL